MRNRIKMKNQAIGGGSLTATLLWTNPNPTVAFTEQTIQLDLSTYKSIYCILLFNKAIGNQIPYFNCQIIKNVDECAYESGTRFRHITFNDTQINIGKGYLNSNYNWIEENFQLVPYKIYGLK